MAVRPSPRARLWACAYVTETLLALYDRVTQAVQRAAPLAYPPITVLEPVKGIDAALEEAA